MNQKKAKSLRRWTSAAAATLLCAGITATALAEGGFDDATADLRVALSGRYSTGTPNADGGVEEIVAYNPENQCAYAVNGQTGELEKIDLATLSSGAEKPLTLTSEKIPVKEILEAEFADFTYGDMTSVAVSPSRAQLFVAVQAQGYTDAGKIAVFDLDGNYICAYDAGVQPDMILVNEESGLVLTANEGEPREGKNAADPQGSVTILDLQQQEAVTVDFTAFDAQREALADAGEAYRTAGKGSIAGDRAAKFQTRYADGERIVWIEDNVLRENTNKLPTHQYIANYIAEHIGEVYTILDSGQKVYIGKERRNMSFAFDTKRELCQIASHHFALQRAEGYGLLSDSGKVSLYGNDQKDS